MKEKSYFRFSLCVIEFHALITSVFMEFGITQADIHTDTQKDIDTCIYTDREIDTLTGIHTD